jgi:hypothetical protein
VEKLTVGERCELRFKVNYRGRRLPLTIRVSKNDRDEPDLQFLTPHSLAAEIHWLMDEFHEQGWV